MLYHLALGANEGNTRQQLREACLLISQRIGEIEAASSVLTTEPVDFVSTLLFSNQVIAVRSDLKPWDVLRITQAIEQEMGRTRKSVEGQHFDRCIDIDLILCEEQVITSAELTLPHPRFRERTFVLNPLYEIAPNAVDPITRHSISHLYHQLNQ